MIHPKQLLHNLLGQLVVLSFYGLMIGPKNNASPWEPAS